MTLQDLKATCQKAREQMGEEFQDEIYEIYGFAVDEVEDGESEENEVSLALDALNELGYLEIPRDSGEKVETDLRTKYNQSKWNGLK